MPSISTTVMTNYTANTSQHAAAIENLGRQEQARSQQSLNNLTMENDATGTLTGTVDKMALALGAVTIAAGVVAVSFQAFREDAALAASVQGAEVESLRVATEGLVTNVDLLRFSQQTLNGEQALSTEQNADAAAQALALSRRFGVDLTQALNDVGEAYRTGSTGPLEQYGIAARDVNSVIEGQTAVFQELNGVVAEVGSNFEGATDDAQRAQVSLANSLRRLQNVIGSLANELGPVLADIASFAEQLLELPGIIETSGISQTVADEAQRIFEERLVVQEQLTEAEARLQETRAGIGRITLEQNIAALREQEGALSVLLGELERQNDAEFRRLRDIRNQDRADQRVTDANAAFEEIAALRVADFADEQRAIDQAAMARSRGRRTRRNRDREAFRERERLRREELALIEGIETARREATEQAFSDISRDIGRLLDPDSLSTLADLGVDAFGQIEQNIAVINDALAQFGDGSTGISEEGLALRLELEQARREYQEVLDMFEGRTLVQQVEFAADSQAFENLQSSIQQALNATPQAEGQGEVFFAGTGVDQNLINERMVNAVIAERPDLLAATELAYMSLGNVAAAALDGIIGGELSVEETLRQTGAAVLSGLGEEAAARGSFYAALSLASFAGGNFGSGAGYAAASAGMFGLAALLGSTASRVGGGGGGRPDEQQGNNAPELSGLDSGPNTEDGGPRTTVFLLGESFTDKPARQRISEFRESGRRAGLTFEGDVIERT